MPADLMRAVEHFVGPLAHDDYNRLDRFSPKLLGLVVELLRRGRERALASAATQAEAEAEEARLNADGSEPFEVVCPDCGHTFEHTPEDDEDDEEPASKPEKKAP